MMNNSSKQKNYKLQRNALIFTVCIILSQIGISIVYALTFQVNANQQNISAICNAIMLAILVVAGFGVIFSYLKKLIWSGIGFTFFITAFSIQLYPLINDFWTKTAIVAFQNPLGFNSQSYDLYLTNASMPSTKNYGNCITNALKCALAIATAFSCILGRAGSLQCFITTVFGVIGFELNRQVILNLSIDIYGTYSIFTFGGFMGLALGLIIWFKQGKNEKQSTLKHHLNQGSQFSASYALIGSLITFALLPILAYQLDYSNNFNIFNLYSNPTSIIIGMGSSLIGACILSLLINGTIAARDIIYAPVAGAIVVGSSSLFIINPVYSLVAGFSGGFTQSFIHNLLENKWIKHKSIISTISWSLFGIQGMIGGVFATGYKYIIDGSKDGIIYNQSTINYNPGFQLLIATISAGIGLGFGLLAGIIIYFISVQNSQNHFTDRSYWIINNGIAYQTVTEGENKKQEVKKIIEQKNPISPIQTQHQPILKVPSKQEKGEDKKQQLQIVREQHSDVNQEGIPDVIVPEWNENEDDFQFEFEMQFSQASQIQNNYHAYL